MSEPRAVYAIADVAAYFPAYKSAAEEEWAAYGDAILLDELDMRTEVQLYEPVTFNLPGMKYTPDFAHLMASGRIVFVEVKGTRKMGSYRDSRAKLRAAAAMHPWFTWIQASQERGGWTIERIGTT